MHLIYRLFWWPRQCAGVIQTVSPNAACPGLLQKPLTPPLGNYLLRIAPVTARGQQANKQQSTNTPTKLAVLMAMVMHQYVTTRIAQWRRSRASLEATGHSHQASTMSNNIKGTWPCWFFYMFHRQNHRKRSWVDAKTPAFNRGMTYQMKEKG